MVDVEIGHDFTKCYSLESKLRAVTKTTTNQNGGITKINAGDAMELRGNMKYVNEKLDVNGDVIVFVKNKPSDIKVLGMFKVFGDADGNGVFDGVKKITE